MIRHLAPAAALLVLIAYPIVDPSATYYQTVLLLKLLNRLLGVRAHFAVHGAFIQTRAL